MSQRETDRPTAMVGREREQTMLRRQVTDLLAGHGRLVLVGGEAGIGKTTLVTSLAHEAHQHGALVLRGHCYDFGTTPPYGPWVEIVSAYRREGSLPPFPASLRDDQQLLDVRDDERSVGGQESLFAAIHDFIVAVTDARPLVLLLEDMHWSDPASLDLLRSLSRHIDALRLLLVVTYRSDEVARRHPLYHLLPGLVRDAGALRIDLRPLTGDALRALAARYRLPTADQERLVSYVQSRAEGNPLYIRELFRTFEEHDILQAGDAGWTLRDLHRMRIPLLVRQLIDERLTRLGGETRELLSVAAVIGQEVPLDVWQRASDADDTGLEAAIEQALEARLIEESISGSGLRFSHALIREALYEGTILTRRRVTHRRVAEAMEHLPQPDPDAVAHHYQQAGDARAADWLVRAGERAQRSYALLIAADRFESAAALMQGDAARDRERGWLLYRAGRAVRGADGARALACLEEAERIGIVTHDPALVAYALSDRGLVRCFLGEPRRGIAEMEAGVWALDALPADQTPTGNEIAAWIVGTAAGTEGVLPGPSQPDGPSNGVDLRRGQLVLWYGVSGHYREAEEHARALVDQAPEAHDDAWAGLGYAHVAAGRPADARRAWRYAREAYQARSRHWPAASIALEELDSVSLAYDAPDRDARERVAAEGERDFRRAQGGFDAPDFARTARLPLLLLEGEWTAARQVAEDLSPLPSVAQMYHHYVLGALNRYQGRPREAWASVRAALPKGLASEPGDCLFQEAMETIRLAADLALDERDIATARRWLEMHSHWLAWSGAVRRQSEDQRAWARYHRAAGDHGRARHYALAAVAHAREPHQPLALLAALRFVGELDAEDGQRSAAEDYLREALVLADTCGARHERALTLLALAELLATGGGWAEANTLLEEARAALVALSATPTLARADALAARLGATPARAGLPAGLTTRECDVLRLLAAGKSNKEIAAALGMSVRTVERHIGNLYIKIDATGRAEAIAFAHRHGLT